MIRTVYAYISIVLSIILSIIPLLILLLLKRFLSEKSRETFVYTITSLWGKWMVALSGSKITIIGKENLPEENVLFVVNHQSYYDIPLLLAFIGRPIGFVAKIEMVKVPVMRTWMKEMKCIFLDRKNTRQSLKTILNGIEHLKNGKSLVLFPEGTRSKTGNMGDFKPGSLKLGIKAAVPIVPITIIGSGNMYEYSRKRFTPCNTKIIIHTPIYSHGMDKEQQNNITNTIRDIIQKPLVQTI